MFEAITVWFKVWYHFLQILSIYFKLIWLLGRRQKEKNMVHI